MIDRLSELNRTERRRIRARIRSGPVNRTLFAAGICSLAASHALSEGSSGLLLQALGWGSAVLAGLLWWEGGRLLLRDYRLRRDVAISETTSLDHGSARQSSYAERVERGMDDPENGELYGLDDDGRTVWRPPGAPFALIEMPPGVGKTVFLVVASILHRAMLGYSLVIPDIKMDLAVMLVRALRRLGFEVWCVNPAKRFLDITGNVELHPFQSMVDAMYGDIDQQKDAFKLAADYAALQNPLSKDEKNPYFVYGSRRAHVVGNLTNALFDPTRCTPTDLYALLADPSSILKRCAQMKQFESVTPNDPIVATAKLEARNLLHRAKKNEENFASFLEGTTQRMIPFNPSGHLAYLGRNAIHNVKAIRERQIILFIMTPLSHMREFADFISLLNHNIIAACKAKPDGHPVHIVGEEALNYRFHDLVADIETLRQLRVTADFYIQSFVGLERQLGREAAAAIEAYTDVRVFAGINSYDRAKRVSDMLADATVGKQDVSYGAEVEKIGLSAREMGRRFMTADEILAMERGQAWMFVRGMRPTRLRLISYAQALPWSDWVEPSPITGTRLHDTPLVSIDYGLTRRVA